MADRKLNVDYVARRNDFGGGFTWRELRALIDQLPPETLDHHALICSEPPSSDNPYGIFGLFTDLDGWGPILVQEY